MRVCGVICEYNPFHSGHAYHLRKLREEFACHYIVCVMSGAFTQRGEAAILSKWARAEMALRNGADIVIELPTLFAVRDAERFARGGVSLLSDLGVVTHLGFGSESGDLDALWGQAKVEANLPAIREGLSRGMTLARARGEAMGQAAGSPNDTLGIEYLRAIAATGSALTPITIRREGRGYHDEVLSPMASATAIRAAIARGEDVFTAMPTSAFALLARLEKAGAIQASSGLDTILLATLRTLSPQTLAQMADIGEGLENRIHAAAMQATDRESLLALCKCKRYTHSRLSRIITQALLGITAPLAAAYPRPTYARILGFRRDAQPLLAQMRDASRLPLVMRAAKYRNTNDAAFALDLHAGDLWPLGLAEKRLRHGGMDLTQGVVIID